MLAQRFQRFWVLYGLPKHILKYFYPINTSSVLHCKRYQGQNIRQVFFRFLAAIVLGIKCFFYHIYIHIYCRKYCLSRLGCVDVERCSQLQKNGKIHNCFYTISQSLHKWTLISDHRYSFVFNIFFPTLSLKWYNKVSKSSGICHIERYFLYKPSTFIVHSLILNNKNKQKLSAKFIISVDPI